MNTRLYRKLFAEFTQLDAITTREDPDGTGKLQSGYDDVFGEIMVFTTNAGERQTARADSTPTLVPCNVGIDSWGALQQLMAGNSPDSKLEIIVAAKDMKRLNLFVPETGVSRIRVNDRMLSLRDKCGHVIYRPDAPLFVTQAKPSFGIAMTSADLMVFTLEDRETFAHGA